MEQKTNDNEISQMEQHVRRLLDKHKKRDEYEKSSSEKLAKKVESDLPELASALRSDDVKHFLNDLKLSRQSKEFTDALNFVLNYRESMEGMHGFIPSSDLAEMIVVYNQSRPQVDILANKKSIREMLGEYTILLGMEENTFSWNIDILSEMFYVEKINPKGQAGESVEVQKINEWKEECERLAKVAEFWQGKYNELNPGFIPAKLDHL